jgi:hypothetical protein
MKKKASITTAVFISLLTFSFCDFISIKMEVEDPKDLSHIDTFKIKYEAEIHGRVKRVDENIYVGTTQSTFQINSKEYRKFVFGDSINSVIAFIRQDSSGLRYIGITGVNYPSGDTQNLKDRPLLYFDKKVNDKWKVNIDSSYFWRREITFAGIEHNSNNDSVFVYNVSADEGYSDVGGESLSKIYYSTEKGFLKFEIKTHWFSVEVYKIK